MPVDSCKAPVEQFAWASLVSSIVFSAFPAQALVYNVSGSGSFSADISNPPFASSITRNVSFSGTFEYDPGNDSTTNASATAFITGGGKPQETIVFNSGSYLSQISRFDYLGAGTSLTFIDILPNLGGLPDSFTISEARISNACIRYQNQGADGNCNASSEITLNNLNATGTAVPGGPSMMSLLALAPLAAYRKRLRNRYSEDKSYQIRAATNTQYGQVTDRNV